MKLLVLGGTRFLGRHLVDAALARGDDVTIFTRGRLPVPWRERVTALVGDRDPRIAPGLAALEARHVGRGRSTAPATCRASSKPSARLLASRVSRYMFVSSMSVYAKTDRPGDGRDARRSPQLADPATEQVMEHYGALKAACEAVVEPDLRDARHAGASGADRRPVRRQRPLRLLGCAIRRIRRLLGDRGRPRRRCLRRASAPCSSSMRAIWRRGCSIIAARDVARHVQCVQPGMAMDEWAISSMRSSPRRRRRRAPAWIDDDNAGRAWRRAVGRACRCGCRRASPTAPAS